MKPVQTYKDCVGVVEDDASVRQALCMMLSDIGLDVRAYASARDYLDDPQGQSCCTCLVLDVRMPGMSGMELQRQLMTQSRTPTIVFITGHGDVPMAVEAMRHGAVDFLQKPFKEQQLLDSVQKALIKGQRLRQEQEKREAVSARQACLTPREKEVLAGLLRGLRSKEIASELGLATKTAEEHRGRIMRKMQATTLADLMAMCK